MEGSGTSRDVIAGLNRYKHSGIRYWGGDLRQGFDLMRQDLPGTFDFVWIHPPYWNMIRHESGASDLSNCASYERFQELLHICLRRCYDALEVGGRLAVLIGDLRRAGKYTAIVKDVLNFPLGELRSVIIKVQHHCTSDRKQYGRMEDVPIRHEYCVVFKKVDTHPTLWPAETSGGRFVSSGEPPLERYSPYGCDDNGRHIRNIRAQVTDVAEGGEVR